MKKIFDGKMYSTETAREVAIYESDQDYRNFHHIRETLYRKRNGEYFIHGIGGPATKYAQVISQNNWCSGEKIIPVSFEEAKKWAEEHLDADEYENEFGDVGESADDAEGTSYLYLTLDNTVAEKIRREARETGCTLGEVISKRF